MSLSILYQYLSLSQYNTRKLQFIYTHSLSNGCDGQIHIALTEKCLQNFKRRRKLIMRIIFQFEHEHNDFFNRVLINRCLTLLTTVFFQTVLRTMNAVLSGSRHSIHYREGMFTLVLLIMHHRNTAFVLELHKKVAFLPAYADIITWYNDHSCPQLHNHCIKRHMTLLVWNLQTIRLVNNYLKKKKTETVFYFQNVKI